MFLDTRPDVDDETRLEALRLAMNLVKQRIKPVSLAIEPEG